MPQLLLDGIDVKTSTLTQKSHRAACCNLLLRVTPENRVAALAEFERVGEFGPYSGLRLEGITDLGFLERFPKLLYLEVRSDRAVSPRPLDGLSNLRGLFFETPGAGIDFACFPELEVYFGDWHPDFRGLATCQELRRLRLWKFKPKSGDLEALGRIPRLEELELVQTGIQSLKGVEILEDLRYLKVSHATRLETLEALAAEGVDLRELSIEKAKKIDAYQPLTALRRLRRLRLSGCAPMESLGWIVALERLDFFAFVDTEVVDGNLSPLLELPRLRYAGWLDRKHYSHKWAAIDATLKERHASAEPQAGTSR